MKRKQFLQDAATLVTASMLPAIAGAEEISRKPLRVAHLCDIHVKPGTIPETGMTRVLHHVQGLKPHVDFMLNGGDLVMDVLEADKQKAATLWALSKEILQKSNSLEIFHTIGNHDIWGWFLKTDKPTNDPLYGKSWVLETLSMPGRYYSFTKANWKFIVLDSTQLNPAGGYIAKLDEEQFEWLKAELSGANPEKYICIVSHIPILSICAGLFFGKTETNGDLLIKRNLMHTDFLALRPLFNKYPMIKACISGHIHMQDEIIFDGVKYYCNGAVSGNWWNGPFQNFNPAYALMEFYEDGIVKRTMKSY